MKPEYENLIRALRIEFTVEIRETDANPDKWYELYVDEGDEIGTRTVDSADTFNEVVACFEQFAEQYGISNTHINIMCGPKVERERCLTSSAKLLNIPKLVKVHFCIESGYAWGGDYPGLSKEKEDAFFAEMRQLFSEAGYEIKPTKYSGCLGIAKEFTDLYCHPMDLSGFCEESRIPEIEAILAKGTTFSHRCTNTNNQVYPYNREQEIEYYRQNFRGHIRSRLPSLFTTRRRNLYKSTREVIEQLTNEIHIDTIEHTTGKSYANPCETYITEIYKEMLNEGLLIETEKQIGTCTIRLCRSANAKELKALNLQKSPTLQNELIKTYIIKQ